VLLFLIRRWKNKSCGKRTVSDIEKGGEGWNLTPCTLVDRQQCFGSTCCVRLQDARIYCVEIEKVAESMAKSEQLTVGLTLCSLVDVLEELAASIFTVGE
jgi:hypothetical protein